MTFYALKITTSRARDSYGYNLLTLTNSESGKKYRTCGGGYDMFGTVVADALNAEYQDRLAKLDDAKFYGIYRNKQGVCSLDGGTGFRNVQMVAEAMGLKVTELYDKSGRNWKTLGAQIQEAA